MTITGGRALVAERGLTPAAVSALIPLMSNVGFEELGLVKALLKRFFSSEPWTALDAASLARAVGPEPQDANVIHRRLDADLTLVAGWVDGTFVVDVERAPSAPSAPSADEHEHERDQPRPVDLGRTFRYGVVPEPTPNPRTLRFAPIRGTGGASRSHRRGDAIDEERVAAIFAVDHDVVDIMVGPDFVAVSIARPRRWPDLLEPVLDAVASGFGDDEAERAASETDVEAIEEWGVDVRGGGRASRAVTSSDKAPRRRTRLDRAWSELGVLDASRPDDLDEVLAAARSTDSARRQVAARLLVDAPRDVASAAWAELGADASRAVRRAALDAIVDAEREPLRPLLERALADSDAWMRWKAAHGLAVLGVDPSRDAIRTLRDDPDFRVRLEAANALHRDGPVTGSP